MELVGKNALVTGGSRGIGRAIALKLASLGANVAINYLRNTKFAEETAKMIEDLGVKALPVKANVAEEKDVDFLFEEIEREFGGIEILISNAASGVLRPALRLKKKHWDWTMTINAGALLYLVKKCYPFMKKAGKGSIVAVSSLGAIRAIPNYAAVGASKAALESLVRHLSIELAPAGINVNIVSAGVVETDALKHFPNRDLIISEAKKKTPAGRLTTPEDVAEVVAFLCSNSTRMIQGQRIIIDGGYSILA